jgi:hypothetical protein
MRIFNALFRFMIFAGLAGMLTGACFAEPDKSGQIGNPDAFDHNILSETFGYGPDDLEPAIETVFQGCSARDCIPAIDDPAFLKATEVEYLTDQDLVLAIDYLGEQRAYPTRFMDRHEIVNDWFGDEPVLITWCPLCGSGLAFERKLDGEAVEFGVSGLLHNNDLVMYDRRSESLWQQISGQAIAGPKKSQRLTGIPASMVYWPAWQTANPNGKVLAAPSADRDYSHRAYADYENSDRMLFPVSLMDARMKPKRVIYGIKIDEISIAIDADWLAGEGGWQHSIEGKNLSVRFSQSQGATATLNDQAVPIHHMFWFAWFSFNPDTALIDASNAPGND